MCGNLLVAALASACGRGDDGLTGPGRDDGPIRVVAGGGQPDTVGAVLPQALVVEVRDSTSRISAGSTVRFTRILAQTGNQPYVSVRPPTLGTFGALASDVTDAQGRASTLVRHGFVAGTARLEVSVPELGLVDTVSFTIDPGTPARLSVTPRDTSVAPGGTYTLRAFPTDQFQNPIPGISPTFAATNVTVSPAGQVTGPNGIARGRIVVTYGELTDTVRVSVVPSLPMVITRSGRVELINADGSGSATLATTPHTSLSPSSVAATTSVVFYQGAPCCNGKLWVVYPGGTPYLLLNGPTRPEGWPRISPDGVWVYFVRDVTTLWRVRLSGTGLDSLTSFTPPLIDGMPKVYTAPTVSPDGRSVAIEDAGGIKIVDVETKATRTVPVTCGSPRYSPDGAYFACASQFSDVSIVGTDGTGHRVLAQFVFDGPDQLSGVDWTPDGKWLLMTPPSRPPVLVEVASGVVLPLTGLGEGAHQASFVR